MDDFLTDFIEWPCPRDLDFCTKKQLVAIANFDQVDIGDQNVKENVQVKLKAKLFEIGVLMHEVQPVILASPLLQGAGFTFEQQRELFLLQFLGLSCPRLWKRRRWMVQQVVLSGLRFWKCRRQRVQQAPMVYW